MSKYNLSELLTEVAGGRIGTLEISARDLVRKMEDLEDKGVKINRFDGLSPDGKTYIEFHVHPMRKYDEDQSFSVYDYKFGFDPMSPEHVDVEYPFSIGGRSAARDSAETVLRSGAMGFDPIFEEKEEPRDGVKSAAAKLGMKPSHVKEDKEKDLINALRFQIMTLEKGIIDKDDFINAVEELAFGSSGPGVNTDDDLEREQRMQIGMRENLDDLNDDEYDDGPDGKFVNELDNTLNVDKVASPDAKAHDYGAEIKGISDEDDTEEKYAHGMVLPLEEMFGPVKFLKSKGIDDDVIKDFMKVHAKDIVGASEDEIMDEFENFRSVNYDYVDEDLKEHFKRFI